MATFRKTAMPKITYIESGGTVHVIDVSSGMSVMEGAVRNDVPGIEGECGGACACATCHVYVDEAWRAASGEPTPDERDMIEFVSAPGPGSRLSCQIRVSEQLDGLVVRLPVSQH
jgi:ferredoxin, 2Fe-2S